jgi:Fusaric acid resistance protein-like
MMRARLSTCSDRPSPRCSSSCVSADGRTSRRRTIVELYLSREPDARYDRHLGFAAGLAVGVPALAAETTGPAHFWILVAIGAWLAVIPAPPAPARERIHQLPRSAALTIAATAVGLATGDRLWALVGASLVFAVIISLPGITAIPLIALVIAAQPSSVAAPVHLGAIALGSVWSSALVMTPWLGGRYGEPVRGPTLDPLLLRIRRFWAALLEAAVSGSPAVRYAVRVSCCFTVTLVLLHLTDAPRPTWALIGILTTLRPSWSHTRSRVVKRLIGMTAGCLLSAVLIVATHEHGVALAAAIVVCATIGRPMRGFNYGYWPIFATPVLLLLIETGVALDLGDIAVRLLDNALGAAVALVATAFIWPDPRHA